ncbi:tape measure protein [Oceanobacillus luteolus]|uniref:phage tail protein n=1 Tax=Oceanobacillus luteolus TaxID=1274358 RepID=UPI00203E7AF1|nr:tape measure protein [Oceanobacillus luteolus]MCM3739239.1 tape measure protein [Oceanobacillus luteolus]
MLELFRIYGKIDLQGGDEANRSIDNIDGGARRATKGIKNFVAGVGKVAAGIGVFKVFSAAVDMVRNSIDGAISRYDTLNSFPRVLQLMGFDAEQSEKAIDKLSDGIDGLPTTLDSVASTTQRIATMTGDLDGAVDTTIALNNAFLASGASTADASRGLEQYVQMLSKGEVDLQSWRSLQETMPIGLNKTAEAFGFTGASAQNDLYDALKDGNITFDQFNDKLVELSNATGGFAEMAREGSSGIRTSWQNMQTAIVKGVADVIGVVDESLDSFGGISGVFDSMKGGIQVFFAWLMTAIPVAISFIERFNPAFQAVHDFIVITVQNIVSYVMTFWGMLVSWWQENNTQILTTAQTIWNTVVSVVSTVIQEVVNFVISIWSTLTTFWQQHGQMIMEATQNFMNVVWNIMQAIWPVIQFLVIDTWNAIKGAIQGAIAVITGIIQFFAALFTGNWSEMWNAIKQIVSGAVQFVWNFIQLWFVGRILKAGKALFTGLRGIITNLWNAVKSIFTSGVNTASNVVNTGFNFIRQIITNILNSIRNTVSNIFNSLRGIVSSAFSRVTSAVRTGINNAYNVVKNKVKDFFNAGKNIVTSIADGIKEATRFVTDAISGVASKVRDFLPFSPAKEGPLEDLDKLDFEGPIGDSIQKGENTIKKKMADMLGSIHPSANVNVGGRVITGRTTQSAAGSQASETGVVATLLQELIQAVREGKNIIMNDREVGRIVEPHVTERQNRKKQTRDAFA